MAPALINFRTERFQKTESEINARALQRGVGWGEYNARRRASSAWSVLREGARWLKVIASTGAFYYIVYIETSSFNGTVGT